MGEFFFIMPAFACHKFNLKIEDGENFVISFLYHSFCELSKVKRGTFSVEIMARSNLAQILLLNQPHISLAYSRKKVAGVGEAMLL